MQSSGEINNQSPDRVNMDSPKHKELEIKLSYQSMKNLNTKTEKNNSGAGSSDPMEDIDEFLGIKKNPEKEQFNNEQTFRIMR